MDFDATGILAVTLIALYCAIFFALAVFGAHRYWLVYQYYRRQDATPGEPAFPDDPPSVLIQLPVFNERYVVERLIGAVARMDYPHDKLHVQVLDDSTDATAESAAAAVEKLRAEGLNIDYVRRPDRSGFKAGALAWGLEKSDAELVAIFDADFIPQPDFLKRTVGHFADPEVAMVQTRWEHLNRNYSLLTRIESMMLDGHFVIEHGCRSRNGWFFNFNGTAGIWRRKAIDDVGGWEHDTLTEDLDLSYRAQIAGWKFIYRPDVATPAEVPVDVLAFKTQQHRWTKGSIQTARKVLGPLWRSPRSFACKLEATLHLLSNLTYVMMFALALVLFPVYALRHRLGIDWVFWIDIPVLLAGTGALLSFYANAQRELGRSPWAAVVQLPALMALGMGMSVNNAWAVCEGWFGGVGEFVRTPKYKIESRGDEWKPKAYAGRRQRWIPAIEVGFLLYFVATAIYCGANGLWWTYPFLMLFLGGYGYVAAVTLRQMVFLNRAVGSGQVQVEKGTL